MATTTANISITSDILSSGTSISTTMTMTKAGTSTGLTETTGLAVRKFSGTNNQNDIITVANESAATTGANKLYIRNTGSSKVNFFRIGLGTSSTNTTPQETEEIGRLYGGDWMFIPWGAEDANHDVMCQPSSTEEMTLEYMLFHE